jgi:hypothetical protein
MWWLFPHFGHLNLEGQCLTICPDFKHAKHRPFFRRIALRAEISVIILHRDDKCCSPQYVHFWIERLSLPVKSADDVLGSYFLLAPSFFSVVLCNNEHLSRASNSILNSLSGSSNYQSSLPTFRLINNCISSGSLARIIGIKRVPYVSLSMFKFARLRICVSWQFHVY